MFLLAAPVIAIAQTPVPTPGMTEDQEMEFEDTHLISTQTGLFGDNFFLNGREINNERDLKKIIASADDDQAMKDLDDSENHQSLGRVLVGGGSGLLVIGLLSNSNNNGAVLYNVLILGGLTSNLLGGMLFRESQNEQTAAVNRYNQIVMEDNGISLLNLPRQQAMGLAFVKRF